MSYQAEQEGRPARQIDTLGRYLHEIGQIPLLTAQEEIELAQAIEIGNLVKAEHQAKEAEVEDFLTMSNADVQKVIAGDDAKSRFIDSNLRLVVSIARKFPKHSGLELKDHIQDGNFGLERAVDKFDWRKGFRFSTYATWWIRKEIKEGIVKGNSLIYLPRNVLDELRASLRLVDWESDQLDAEAERQYRLSTPTSLDAPLSNEAETSSTMTDLIVDGKFPQPEKAAIQTLTFEGLQVAIDKLNPVDRMLIRLRFYKDLAPVEIGPIMGMSPNEVSNRVKRILKKLRQDEELESTYTISS